MRLPDPQRSRVVLIGTSKYRDPDHLPDLPQVSTNVADMAAALTDPAEGVVHETHCHMLEDEADIRLIGHTLQSAAEQAEELLLVYFSGHGLVGGRRHDLYLALPDSQWAAPTSFNSLKYDELRSIVLDSPAETKVIILDCCFSGRAITDGMADPESEIIGQTEVDGSYVLTSAQGNQVALIVPGEEHTAFTGRLLTLLRSGMPNGPEYLTVEDLYKELRSRMAREGLSQPQKRDTANAGLLPLARNRAYAATALPLLRERVLAAAADGANGDWAAAARQLRAVLDELNRVVGADHPDVLRARQLLAHAIGAAGDPLEAVTMLRTVLSEQTRLVGPDHPDTLTTRQYLAVNLGEAGYRDQAVEILRVLLPDRRRILGGEHEQTLRTLHMLARNVAALGGGSESIALLRELVAARERVLGPDHPHAARARRDLAALLAPKG
jgi:hypothetical protein